MQKKAFKLTAVALLLTPSLALASQSDDNSLGEVVVEAKSTSTLLDNSKAYTTSAMKTTTGLTLSPKETPQSVSVITQAQLDDQGIHTLADALKTTTGVNVTRDGSRMRFESRGYRMSRIEEDGISSMMAGTLLNSYSDPQSMTDLAIYDHIEVVRGATGLTQGTGEPGGTINAVRKKPTSERQTQLGLSVNQYGGVRGTTDVSGSLNDSQSVRGRLVAVGEKTQSFKDTDGSNRLIYGVMDADVGDSAILTVGVLYQNQHDTPDPTGLPMAADGSDLGLPVDTFLGAGWNKSIARKFNTFAELDYFINQDWHWNNKVSYTRSNYSQRSGSAAGATNTGASADGSLVTNNRLSRWDDNGSQFTYQTNLTGKYNLFGRSHELFSTYSYSVEKLDSYWKQFTNAATYNVYTFNPTSIAEPNFSQPDPTTGTYRFLENEQYTLTTHGISFGTRFNVLDNLHLLVGTRYSRWKSDYHDHYQANVASFNDNATFDPNYKRRTRFVPYAGLTWDVSPNHSLYYSYTQIFRPQLSAKDINGKDLDPVLGTNQEIGWKADWYGNNALNTAVALFQIDEKNRSITIPRAQSSTGRAYQVPFGKVRSHGVDVEISGKLTDNWQMFAGYTFNTSKYRSTESTSYTEGMNFSKHTPKHMFRLYTNYRLPASWSKWTLGAGVNAQSETNSLNNVAQGGYAVWNANAQYEFNKNVTMNLIVKNIFDRRYYENHRTRSLGLNNYYGEPRNFTLNVDWKF